MPPTRELVTCGDDNNSDIIKVLLPLGPATHAAARPGRGARLVNGVGDGGENWRREQKEIARAMSATIGRQNANKIWNGIDGNHDRRKARVPAANLCRQTDESTNPENEEDQAANRRHPSCPERPWAWQAAAPLGLSASPC